jgi:hypothetical protein
MKIWKEFNSSHSSNITIIGKFENVNNADTAMKMIKDFALSSWEERYPSIDDFKKYWSENFNPSVRNLMITESELDSGIDNEPDIEIENGKITISSFRTDNIMGIIKLMRFAGAKRIIIE